VKNYASAVVLLLRLLLLLLLSLNNRQVNVNAEPYVTGSLISNTASMNVADRAQPSDKPSTVSFSSDPSIDSGQAFFSPVISRACLLAIILMGKSSEYNRHPRLLQK